MMMRTAATLSDTTATPRKLLLQEPDKGEELVVAERPVIHIYLLAQEPLEVGAAPLETHTRLAQRG